jgi:hypothetical protein
VVAVSTRRTHRELEVEFGGHPHGHTGHDDLRVMSLPSGRGGVRFPARWGGRARQRHVRCASVGFTKKCAILYR